MKRDFRAALFVVFLNAMIRAAAQSAPPTLTYVPGSSVKLYQINGDCDWAVWDATITNKTPTCKPTTSKTATNADVLGDDVATSFENNGELIMMFGDTIGAAAAYHPTYIGLQNTFSWNGHDPIARSTTLHAEDGLLLNFFLSGNHGLEVAPPPQPNGTPVDMGAFNVPNGGITLNGTIYISYKTGHTTDSAGNGTDAIDYAVLGTFDETTQTFTSGRTTSALPGGHFVTVQFYEAPVGILGSPAPVIPEPDVVMFGLGLYRASNIYLSVIPSSEFASGVDSSGNSATRYFTGMSNGQPTWSSNESDSVPVVTDVNPANPSIGNLSAFYSQQLGLWLMTYDGGKGSDTTVGVYFAYAPQPWGPWSAPQRIFNDCRDNALGVFIHYYYAVASGNTCPTAMPSGVTSAPNSAGPAGPTIDMANNVPQTTKGGGYAPQMIQRFTEIAGNSLKIFYTFSTWNPYTVVLMESDFTIAYGPAISLVVNAEGGGPAIAPNTWVQISGANLAPAGYSSPACAPGYCWQASDFVGNQMPTQLDHVSATVNGKNAYVYYISPAQINVLTPPDAMNGPVQVVVTNNGTPAAAFTAQAQPLSPSFFVFNGGPYVAATHVNGAYLGPTTLYSGLTTPAKPGEVVVIYANGFGITSTLVASGSTMQSGSLSPLPVIKIGGVTATVQFAGLVAPGEYQFNVVVPSTLANGDQSITATYGGQTTQAGTLITIQH
jgi:uncharacterized protein (TIGR03437 family)